MELTAALKGRCMLAMGKAEGVTHRSRNPIVLVTHRFCNKSWRVPVHRGTDLPPIQKFRTNPLQFREENFELALEEVIVLA